MKQLTKKKGITICKDDYKSIQYDLNCLNENQKLVITRVSASFVSSLETSQYDCNTNTKLVLNISNSVSAWFCEYCFDKPSCRINADLIDEAKMFSSEFYDVGNDYYNVPSQIGIYYECIGKYICY